MIYFLEIINIQNMITEIEIAIRIHIPHRKDLIFIKF